MQIKPKKRKSEITLLYKFSSLFFYNEGHNIWYERGIPYKLLKAKVVWKFLEFFEF